MTMTLVQLGWAIAGFALFTIVHGWFRKITEIAEHNKAVAGTMEDFMEEWGKALTELIESLNKQKEMDDAMDHIVGFQDDISTLIEDGLEVENCRRCGKSPVADGNSQTLYDGKTECFRLTCHCHERATSMWHDTASDIIGSWNTFQTDWEHSHVRDIYEMLSAEHPAIPECAHCGEKYCWTIQFGDETESTFRIEHGCDNHQNYHTYHKTLEAAVNSWDKQQVDIRRIMEIAAEDG